MIAKRLAALALTVLPFSSVVLAQRPADVSICDYYTGALLNNNSAENQFLVLTLLTNTVVIGNYTQPNVGIAVPGILAVGEFNGEEVNLLPYFNGCLNSTNRNGSAVKRNFLDGGGAAPLMMNLPANNSTSRQLSVSPLLQLLYLCTDVFSSGLMNSLYSFFGRLLDCSTYGTPGFPVYNRTTSMAQVHRYVNPSIFSDTLDLLTLTYLASWPSPPPKSATSSNKSAWPQRPSASPTKTSQPSDAPCPTPSDIAARHPQIHWLGPARS
jgi:hypothetical protein